MDKEAEILQIIADITGHPIDYLKNNMDTKALWDSFNTVEIVFALEEKFKQTFAPEDIAELTTINAIISKVK